MINDFDFFLNTKFIFAHNAEDRVGSEMALSGITKVLIHHDSGDYLETSGLLKRVRSSLTDAGVEYIELGGVQPNPRLSLVREGIVLAKTKNIEGVIAIGGGSVIDSAKAIALGAASETDVWNFFLNNVKPKNSLPVGAIVTLPASGSESSKVVVINNGETHQKLLLSDPIVRPRFAFMNPALTTTVPTFPTACGIVDMFSHVCERYFNDDYNWGVADRMCEGVLRTLVDVGTRCVHAPEDYNLRAELMWISSLAQNNTLSIGRDEDWVTHILANEISALYDTPHGATLSIIMGSWMRVAAGKEPRRFARYAQKVFDIDPGVSPKTQEDETEIARKGILATEKFFKSLGMPTSFSDARLPRDGIKKMLNQISFSSKNETIGSVAKLSRTDCFNIFKLASDK